MLKKLTIVAVVAALALPAAAAAHVTIQPRTVTAGGFTRIDMRVPTERDDASTSKIELQMPDGFYSVSVESVPGWKITQTMEQLAQPVEVSGNEVTEQVDVVTFEAIDEESRIHPHEFRDFGMSVRMPEQPGTLTFKAIQTYDSGEVVRWINAPDQDEPAPTVELVAPVETEEAAATTSGDDSGSDWLSIVALVVGGLGLLAGLAALAGRRRPTTA